MLDVIKSILGIKRCRHLILNEKFSETPRCSEEEVESLLFVEWMEHDVKDDVLASDPAQKVLWLSNLNSFHY